MKTAFLFSGQGAQYPGMMKDLFDLLPDVRDVFRIADKALGRKISELCFDGTQDDLNITHNTQPCVFACDLAAYTAAVSMGVQPYAVAGFSLGEYAALTASGVIDIYDAFHIIQLRADAMQTAVPYGEGAMAAIMKIDAADIIEMCKTVNGYVEAVNYNCPGQIVISGETEAVNCVMCLAKERKGKACKLPVSAPFHCKLMKPAADVLRKAFSTIQFSAPNRRLCMNVDAQFETDIEAIKTKLIKQVYSPVMWQQTLQTLRADGVTAYIELGPGKTLSSFVRKTLPDVLVYSIETPSALNTIKGLRDLSDKQQNNNGYDRT